MSEHPNVTLVRSLFDAFARRDIDAIDAIVPENLVWHFPGRAGQLAGSHVGQADVLLFLANVERLTGGTFQLELDDVTASDRHAVALFRGRGRRGDRTLDNPTALVLRVEGGRIVEVREFVWDLYAVDEFWS